MILKGGQNLIAFFIFIKINMKVFTVKAFKELSVLEKNATNSAQIKKKPLKVATVKGFKCKLWSLRDSNPGPAD